MKLYKVISPNHQSQNGGSFDWTDYLPTNDGPGKWTPEVDVSPCHSGYHVTPYPCMWMEEGSLVFEVECKGDGKGQSDVGTIDKIAFPSIRLTRLVEQSFDGDCNSGFRNSGFRNSGDRNSGYWNSGFRNSGNGNSGDRNSGHGNSGDRNSGYWNSGDRNSGDRNSGDRNSGDRNSGFRNSGNGNSGDRNSGDRNSGNWNACDRESGFLNSEASKQVRVFNKPCDRDEWDAANVPNFLCFTTASDKTYQESFQASWESANEDDQAKLFYLPNFDAQVFYEISGIDLRDDPRTTAALRRLTLEGKKND